MTSHNPDLFVASNRLLLTNQPQSLGEHLPGEGLEAKLGTPRRDWLNYPGHVVTDETEPRRPRLSLHGSSEGSLADSQSECTARMQPLDDMVTSKA